MKETNTLVIGAGQAGLAASYHLQSRGTTPLIVEANQQPGGSWRDYYDSLQLFSPAQFSSLPGLPFPGNPNRYPTRDDTVNYLNQYAAHLNLDIAYNQRVTNISFHDDTHRIVGENMNISARNVIVATGSYANPYTPAIPGMSTFTGTVMHAAHYRNPKKFEGHHIAVVGAGNSAVQIACELAPHAHVTLYSRAPLTWRKQRILNRDVHWWLIHSGYDFLPVKKLLPPHVPVIDSGNYQEAFRNRTLTNKPMFHAVEGNSLINADGQRSSADTIIFATGYKPHLPFLHNTPAVNHSGMPLHKNGISTTVPRLGYVGLEYQRTFASATLRGVGRDAKRVVKNLTKTRNND
ncbi:flavin-containing monooxygenase [Timonella sp. A28]|uniref:flavin-containing monooxygenase n=1 Tax=Timonella sp. A28 TaxID=3442640 RepID=UPI003EC14792